MSDYIQGRYSTAQANRQMLLDFLSTHVWASTKECAVYSANVRSSLRIKKENQLVNNRLHRMLAKGEVEKREFIGPHGKQQQWKALVSCTVDAKDMMEKVYGEEFLPSLPKPRKQSGWVDGKYVHQCGDNPDISTYHSGQGMVGSVSWMRREGSYT